MLAASKLKLYYTLELSTHFHGYSYYASCSAIQIDWGVLPKRIKNLFIKKDKTCLQLYILMTIAHITTYNNRQLLNIYTHLAEGFDSKYL